MAERHVSRWRLPSERHAAASSSVTTASSVPHAEPHSNATSLRYLDEFVRKLQCAPRLLEHQLFPDAKEITESMGLFNAVRRYVVHDTTSSDEAPGSSCPDTLADGIVVVGDGNTPRSAAMFAFRLKHWKCYSIDPAMELSSSSERAAKWESIENLVVIRNKIENVRIRLKRAVVVLVHAHVTLAQALSAVECEELVGVVTMPCCNWYGKQEELFGKQPNVVYDDFSILSDHRELRVWVDPRGDGAVSDSSRPLAVDQSAALMKGCVQKDFVADYGVSEAVTKGDQNQLQKKKQKAEPVLATALLQQTLQSHKNGQSSPVPASIATPAQLEKVVNRIEKDLPDKTATRVLVLSAEENSGDSRNCLVGALLSRGYQNVFTLKPDTDTKTVEILIADVLKHSLKDVEPSAVSVAARLASRATSSSADALSTYSTKVTVAGEPAGTLAFDCVVDHGLLFRSLRNQPKKVCGAVFQQLVQLATSLTVPSSDNMPRLISVSPRKDWRKVEFLANEQLGIQLSSAQVAADGKDTSVLFVYSCRATTTSTLHAETTGSSAQAQKKQHALRLKEALERDFGTMSGAKYVQTDLVSARALSEPSGHIVALVQLSGIVQHLRRFTTGPSFFSVAASESSSFHDHLQISVDPLELERWAVGTDAATLTIDAVLRLLHKGDLVECVGEMTRNAQQQPMLRLHAMRFVQSEFQAYQ